MRKIQFYVGMRPYDGRYYHTLFDSILEYPPEDYSFIYSQEKNTSKMRIRDKRIAKRITNGLSLKTNYVINFLDWQFRWYLNYFFKETRNEADLIFSAHRPILKKTPWVVMIEHVGDFCPVYYDLQHLRYYKPLIEKILSSNYCKKIMPYLDTEKKTLTTYLDCTNFESKIEVVNLAILPKIFKKKYGKDRITLLFLGTVHKQVITETFERRGGREVLEAFNILDNKYDNLELIIRATIPLYARHKYSKILTKDNVKIFEHILSFEQFGYIMENSDILLHPGVDTPALTFLDAMSYEMPIVTTNWRGNFEMVKNGETGFLIRQPYHIKPGYLFTSNTMKKILMRGPYKYVINDLVEKTSILIQDKNLRKKMGIAARKEIERGKFSIKNRNKKLKCIFDESIGD